MPSPTGAACSQGDHQTDEAACWIPRAIEDSSGVYVDGGNAHCRLSEQLLLLCQDEHAPGNGAFLAIARDPVIPRGVTPDYMA